nr:hypothetical protein CFP56_13431 [Quercus suber]
MHKRGVHVEGGSRIFTRLTVWSMLRHPRSLSIEYSHVVHRCLGPAVSLPSGFEGVMRDLPGQALLRSFVPIATLGYQHAGRQVAA